MPHFEAGEDECLGLFGTNGAGKSATIRSIRGLCPVTGGKVFSTAAASMWIRGAYRLLGVSSQEEMLDRDSHVLDRLLRYAACFAEHFARLMQLPGPGTRVLAVDLGDYTASRPLGSGPVFINSYLFWPYGGSVPSGSLHGPRSLGDRCAETSAWVLLRAAHRQEDA